MPVSINLPVINAPANPVSAVTSAATTAATNITTTATSAVSGIGSGLQSSLPSISAPSLSLSSISSATGITVPSAGSIASSMGVPTSLGGLANSAGVPSLSSIAGTPSLSGITSGLNPLGGAGANLSNSLGGLKTSIPQLQIPKVPSLPGLDKAGILLGSGKKFAAEQVAKYASIVPPFVPGMTINIGMVAGALSIIKSVASANPTQILNQITQNIAGDLKEQAGALVDQAKDASGLSGIQDQIAGVQGQVQGTVGQVQGIAQEAVNSATSTVNTAVTNITNPPVPPGG